LDNFILRLEFKVLEVARMVEVYLKVRINKYKTATKRRCGTLAEYFSKSNQIHVYLFNLKPSNWNKFISTFNGLINHEMTHHFLKGMKRKGMVEEIICERMEVHKVDW